MSAKGTIWLRGMTIAWTAALAACSDNVGPNFRTVPPSTGLIVSSPVSGVALASRVGISASPARGSGVAYVSLTPGTAPGGSRATIHRVGSAVTLTTAVLDGGFDPVPIDAAVGDSIEVVVSDAGGSDVLRLVSTVAASRPPVVVRTDPPPNKRDVPLNAAVVVVFSEPVAGATLTSSSVLLVRDEATVPGAVSLLEGSTAAIVFAPAAHLEPNTDYRLVVTRSVRDLQDRAIPADTSIPFTTGTTVVGPASLVRVYPDTATLRATSQLQLFVESLDSMSLRVSGRPVSWSSDNPTVATVSSTGLVTGLSPGQARIWAEVDGQSGAATVRVGELESVMVTPDSAIVLTGLATTLTAVLRDAAGGVLPSGTVSWHSSDVGVATVAGRPDGTALVTAVAAGTATITATAENKSGTAVVAAVVKLPGTASGLIAFEAMEKIWIENADGSLPTVLSDNVVWRSGVSRSITWSPDGRTIAFAGSGTDTTTKREIYLMKVDGSGLTRLTFGTASDWDPDWSPDGSRIAFVSDRSGVGSDIYVMNADGSGVHQVTSTQDALAPAWSPDGRKIAFAAAGNVIYTMNADGSALTKLSASNASDHDPAWSPDGAKIVFGTSREGNGSVIYSMNADGSGVTRLTEGSQPTWSPNGRIAFVSPDGSTAELWSMNGDGSGLTRLGGPAEGIFWVARPAWSPPAAQLPMGLSIQKAPTESGDGQTDTVLATLKNPLRVLVQHYGVPVRGVAVSWTSTNGNLSAATTITDSSGIASVSLTLGPRSDGTTEIEAAVPGGAGSPTRLQVQPLPGNAVLLVPASEGFSTGVGLVDGQGGAGVAVTDAYGNFVRTTTTHIVWSVATGGGSILPLQDTTRDGHSEAVITFGSEEGIQTVTATATDLPTLPQVTFTNRVVTAIVWNSPWGVDASGNDACVNVFSPTDVTIPAGRTVAWLSSECPSWQAHTVTFEDDPVPPASSDPQYPVYHFRTFTTPGVYRYRCTRHSTSFTEGEVGTVTVQ